MSILSSVVITKSNVFTQTFANIFNLINNRSNVPDPNDSTGDRKFVYTREPNFMSDNFEGYPVIYFDERKYSQKKKTADGTKAIVTDEIKIIVMSQDKHADSSGDPSGLDTLNNISDDILETLNNKINSMTLRNNGLSNKEFTSVDFDWGEQDGKKIFRRDFPLIFNSMRIIA